MIFPTKTPKRINVLAAMQSNGRGHISHPSDGRYGWRQTCRYGPPMIDPIDPRGNTIPTNHLDVAGSMWPCIAEELYRRGAGWNMWWNTALGNTSMSEDWWGYSGGLVAQGAPGWDPNNYLIAARDHSLLGDYDERWWWIGEGSADASLSRTLKEMTDLYVLLAQYALSQGATGVILCCSSHYEGGPNVNFMEEVVSPARADALTILASEPRVHAGWDIAGTYGRRWNYHDVIDDTSSAIDTGSTAHWAIYGYEICINLALEALGPNGAGWYTTPHTRWTFAGSGRTPPALP